MKRRWILSWLRRNALLAALTWASLTAQMPGTASAPGTGTIDFYLRGRISSDQEFQAFLMPAEGTLGPIRSSRCSVRNTCFMDNVAAGDYWVGIFDRVNQSIPSGPESLEALKGFLTRVTVEAGATTIAELRISPWPE